MSQPSTSCPSSTNSPTSTPPANPSPLPLRPIFLTLLLACPLLVLLPPRKLDLYTFSLSGAWVYSAEELAFGQARRQRTGNTGVMGILGKAQVDETSGAREERLLPGDRGGGEKREDDIEGLKGMAKKIWMGDERHGWQKRRLEKEKEELEAGKGYGDIIMEQVKEVFPGFGGRRKEDGEDEKEA
ncbi:hypothetical protein OEA41_006091 [Lepraria neglecta]|uniref:Uncharacterized protein n=1 Tax=Lepraria neglecta TaxID=209136 RepID=A0AAE0DJX5_9LECA|nr:hypothetical protein OEA41_006091 [Lepraria neglecta]